MEITLYLPDDLAPRLDRVLFIANGLMHGEAVNKHNTTPSRDQWTRDANDIARLQRHLAVALGNENKS